MKKRVLALAAVLALALVLTACGEKGSMAAEPLEEANGVKVIMEKAGDGTAVSGDITIEDGQCLVLSPNLEKGSVQVRVFLIEREPTAEDMGIGDEPVLDETVDGRVMSSFDLEPGDYMLGIISKDNPTGTLLIFSESAEELQAQNESLTEAMDQAGVEMPEEAE